MFSQYWIALAPSATVTSAQAIGLAKLARAITFTTAQAASIAVLGTITFKSSLISCSSVGWPTSTLAGAAMGGIKVSIAQSSGTATAYIPLFNVASS